jgi:hypothetical protein
MINVHMSINFAAEDKGHADALIKALGLPVGAVVNTVTSEILEDHTGTVQQDGTIVQPTYDPGIEEVTPQGEQIVQPDTPGDAQPTT